MSWNASPVRIGLISDTHLTLGDERLTSLVERCRHHFAGVEMVLHAGDIVDPRLLHLLRQPLVAVRGNLDPPELPLQRVVRVGGKKIGLIHGWGAKYDLESRIVRAFQGEEVDCIVYGHSHQPVCHEVEGILLVNPGSPTDRRGAPWHSLAILTIDDTISAEIIPLDDLTAEGGKDEQNDRNPHRRR